MNAREKLAYDAGWRSSLNPAALDEVDGPEVFAEVEHYAQALRAVLDLHNYEHGSCGHCGDTMLHSYPCATVQAIDAVLTVPVPVHFKEGDAA